MPSPAFNEKTFDRFSYLTGTAPTARMTVRGTLDRATILFALAVAAAASSWVFVSSAPALAYPVAMGGALLGFGVAIATSLKPTAAPYLAPIYALLEGVFLGSLSRVLEASYPGIALQAMMGTGAVTGVMLVLYRFRVVRATPTFTKIVVGLTAAVAVMYLVAFGMRLFGGHMPFLNDATPIGIGLSLFLIGLAAMNLILDFDIIERGERTGRPKAMEWYAAFGLLVTVVWLYVEFLRLISKLNRR